MLHRKAHPSDKCYTCMTSLSPAAPYWGGACNSFWCHPQHGYPALQDCRGPTLSWTFVFWGQTPQKGSCLQQTGTDGNHTINSLVLFYTCYSMNTAPANNHKLLFCGISSNTGPDIQCEDCAGTIEDGRERAHQSSHDYRYH